ncbi:hypothetical protein TsFJ059_007853 [Trichoderma semiorbis]|uniref:Uncharacterized protein n=1 Tax=Trichoderma semiorbis TaxID=1491008 RepID=A0A9P8HC18_9HYPO|nr:hypothetical protein TsFJ059_007853 [Trichoderma semiorbis]
MVLSIILTARTATADGLRFAGMNTESCYGTRQHSQRWPNHSEPPKRVGCDIKISAPYFCRLACICKASQAVPDRRRQSGRDKAWAMTMLIVLLPIPANYGHVG